jgi:hypothetical protein
MFIIFRKLLAVDNQFDESGVQIFMRRMIYTLKTILVHISASEKLMNV